MDAQVIVLASKSPRRRELFSLVREKFVCAESHVDESVVRETDPAALCLALGTLKCGAVAQSYPRNPVVGCDTVVSFGGRILGKPRGREEALAMLRALSGNVHSVYTGVCVIAPAGRQTLTCRTDVEFYEIPEAELAAYVDSGDPYDKAGAYGIQGGAAKFVKGIEGDYFNVMGLPVSRLHVLLRSMGL
ncbi:MAG: Maf family protein [Oscillospiraceae bacterium]|nr:Maf family protein [Oscillospiraceae bacterium]